MRASGILMPVFSLPNKYGIGCFSKEAYRFVDFLEKAGQTFWQILPIGPTGYGDSPYQSFSTFAGNPYFIDPDTLIRKGYLEEKDCKVLLSASGAAELVDYGFQYRNRYPVLRKAFKRWDEKKDPSFGNFLEKNKGWVGNYALFMALKDHFEGQSFVKWDDDIRYRKPEAVAFWKKKLDEDIRFYEFLQYEFDEEWRELKAYANRKGIRIIGDIPIYVSPDSADLWADPELFQLDERENPVSVSGCPPDGFSATGQLWGNPLYDWEAQDREGYTWWIHRIRRCRELYDVIRIDHFRGFDAYYSIPYGAKTAFGGEWKKGPGMRLFRALKKALGDTPIIAEDLGYITDSVRQLVRDSGFPNMKVIEFAFDSRDSSGTENYLPHNYTRNCVVYTGTHDNETLKGWLHSIQPEERERLRRYVMAEADDDAELIRRCIGMAEASVADTAVIPMQDWLGLDNRARINRPSTLGTNWRWRMKSGAADDALAARIRSVTEVYGRENPHIDIS